MRALFAGVVVLSMGTGACALIAGLNGYEGKGDADGSTPIVGKDDVSTSDDTGTTPLNMGDDQADADVPDVETDGYYVLGADDAALSPDVNTKCDTTTCSGCCLGGQCYGGQSVATCGTGANACKDCTSQGACSNGACVAPKPDASAMMCAVANCHNACIPFYQGVCCKSDQTCGCQVLIPKGSCK